MEELADHVNRVTLSHERVEMLYTLIILRAVAVQSNASAKFCRWMADLDGDIGLDATYVRKDGGFARAKRCFSPLTVSLSASELLDTY